jgi:hypothetical protein
MRAELCLTMLTPCSSIPFYSVHTAIQCLISIPVCLESSYLILTDPVDASANYTVGYTLDNSTKAIVVGLAQQIGSCTTCVSGVDASKLQQGLRVALNATVTAVVNGSLPTISASADQIQVVTAKASTGSGSSVTGTSAAGSMPTALGLGFAVLLIAVTSLSM